MAQKRRRRRSGADRKEAVLPVYNVKEDWPSVDEARKLLIKILEAEKRKHTKAIKIIHGWGSTGMGGKLKAGLHISLQRRVKEGKIRAFIDGNDFSFHQGIVKWLKDYPVLTSDSDFNRCNPGITIILLS